MNCKCTKKQALICNLILPALLMNLSFTSLVGSRGDGRWIQVTVAGVCCSFHLHCAAWEPGRQEAALLLILYFSV